MDVWLCLDRLPTATTTYILEAAKISGEIVRLVQTIEIVAPKIFVVKDMYLRKGPGSNYEILRPLAAEIQLLALAHPINFMENTGVVDWLYVKVADSGQEGWVEASLVVHAAGIELQELPAPPPPPPTPTLIPSATATETPVPTPTSPPAIFVAIDPKVIKFGDCVTLRWNIQKVKLVYLNGQPVTGTRSDDHNDVEDRVCLTETTTFTWEIEFPDGTKTKREETVLVVTE